MRGEWPASPGVCVFRIVGKLLLQCAAFVFAATAPWGAGLRAAEYTVTLDGGTWSLPWGTAASGGEILVELDGYDITSVVAMDAQGLTLPLSSLGLEPTRHELKVSRTDETGAITVLAEHVLDVFQRPGVRKATRQWNVLLSNAWRVAEHAAQPGVDDSQADATLQWGGVYETSVWRAQDSLSALWSAQASGGLDTWQLPGYELLLERRIGPTQLGLALGDDVVPIESLLFSGFSRRGLRAQVNALEERIRMQAFTLHTDPVTQADVDVVPLDADGSMTGGFASIAPFSKRPDALVFTAGWVDGRGTNGGAAVAAPEGVLTSAGRAWNAALDSYAWQRALWLHGEYARADFDVDGSGARVTDAARLASLQLTSNGGLTFAALDQWALGLEYRRIGAQFFALSNLSLPADLEARRATLALGRRGLSVETAMLAQRSDVDDQPLIPRIDTRARSATLRYAPMWADVQRVPWRWIGTPSLSLSYERATNVARDGDALAQGFDVNNLQRSVGASLQFSGEKFGLGFDYSGIERDDDTAPLFSEGFEIYTPVADTRERSFGVNGYWRPNERFSIAPQWQRVRNRELGSGALTENDLWSLQLQATLIPEVLSVQTSWSDTRDGLSQTLPLADPQRSRARVGAFDLAWRPTNGRGALLPRIDCHVRAAYADNSSLFVGTANAAREWQVSVSFDLTWARGN
jgi:hypothetical protein